MIEVFRVGSQVGEQFAPADAIAQSAMTDYGPFMVGDILDQIQARLI